MQGDREEGQSGPEPKEGTRRNKAAEYKLTAEYSLRNPRQWLYSIRRDGEKNQEGIEMSKERQQGWHMIHRIG